MGDCVKSYNFYESLIHLANNSNLPVSTAYFVIKAFYNEMTNVYQDAIHEELNEKNKNNFLNLNVDGDGNVSFDEEESDIEE